MKTSPEYRQKCVALADRVEDCLRGQPVDLALHALALVMAGAALRWEDSDKVVFPPAKGIRLLGVTLSSFENADRSASKQLDLGLVGL